MQTNSLNDLKKLNVGPTFYGSYRPGSYSVNSTSQFPRLIQSWSSPFDSLNVKKCSISVSTDEIQDEIISKYLIVSNYHKSKIRFEMQRVYGREYRFNEKTMSDTLILPIKELIRVSGKTVTGAVRDIRRYLGYRCSFIKSDGTPIDFSAILYAYMAVQDNVGRTKVESILYEV